ncbi:hypothetical protein FB567DRAFT_571048 [Paraphoma chrysanthemicola]|uniref:Uncharacterized protein n=1 Tax=Paraphoma chrysanthemicola TaxID=798071 RepID=A0A8K0R312_9PLEO|nr:hypothetical protein FB567DRAFT_571048 [Paraphoma chrysanthemicola]
MPTFARPTSSRPATPPLVDPENTPPFTRPSTPTPLESWDTNTFAEKSTCLSPSPNGNWRTNLTHPIDTAASINASLSWHSLRNTVSHAAESASDTFHDRLNNAFQGHDVPAMHDRVMALVTNVSMPSLRDVSRSFDHVTDGLVEMRESNEHGSFVDEELVSDHFSFARHIGTKAKRALVKQGICREWEIEYSKAGREWQARLDGALVDLFKKEKKYFCIEQLFGMNTIWVADVTNKVWRLELDTGMVEVAVKGDGDEFEERVLFLRTEFGLPEEYGSVRIANIERNVVEEGDWMAVDL